MPLVTEVNIGAGDVVLDGVAAPSKRGTAPQFSVHVYCGQTAGWMKMPFGTETDLDPSHIVLDGVPAPRERGTAAPLLFGPCLLWPRSPISASAEHLFAYCEMLGNCRFKSVTTVTSSSAAAERPREPLSQLKSCQLLHNCTKNHI